MEAPLRQHRESVRPEWTDYNGHMNVAYYTLLFDRGTDTFFRWLGIGEEYTQRTGLSTFALEAHITYRQELHEGDPVAIETQLLDADHKRLHYFHRMVHAERGFLAATLEQISMHIDLAARASAPFRPNEEGRFVKVLNAHADLPRPPEIGSVIGIRRSRSANEDKP